MGMCARKGLNRLSGKEIRLKVRPELLRRETTSQLGHLMRGDRLISIAHSTLLV